MAGEDETQRPKNQQQPSDSSRGRYDDENPFVAFRRFADEQISSMLQSVTGLPSSVHSPHSDHWPVFTENNHHHNNRDPRALQRVAAGGNEQEDGAHSPNASTDPSAQRESSPTSSRWPEPEDPWNTRRGHNHPNGSSGFFDDVDFFFDSFFDRYWFNDAFSSRFFHPYQRPFFANMMSDDSPAWPVTYLMFSPYSPLHLERQAQYRAHRDRGVFTSLMSTLKPPSSEHDPAEPQWREAFEDLLRLENGMPMLERAAGAQQPSQPQESAKDWLQGLVKRGSMGDRWKYVAGKNGHPWSSITLDNSKDNQTLPEGERAEDNAERTEIRWNEEDGSGATTELDMYDRFLTDIEARQREFFDEARASPLMHFLFQGLHSPRDRRVQKGEDNDDDTESWIDLVSGGQKKSVPDSVPESSPSSPSSSLEQDTSKTAETAQQQPYVISTKITTDRTRLSDGSVQTKTTKTKRYADGREETNESVEVVHPSQQHSDGDPSSGSSKKGWFWTD